VADQAAARTIAAAQQAAAEQAQLQAYLQQRQAAASADSFLANLSNESLEVLSHFGPETPKKLNTYSCQLEDALLQAVEHQRQQAEALQEQYAYIEQVQEVLAAAAAEREAMQTILTDPDQLAAYVKGFYAEDGPYPVQTRGEEAQSRLAEGLAVIEQGQMMGGYRRPDMDLISEAQQQQLIAEQQAQQPFQRPTMPMPSPQAGSRMAGAGLWSDFSQLMDTRPQDAWRLLDQASPEDLRRKVLIAEG
jgi:hypothetical protein